MMADSRPTSFDRPARRTAVNDARPGSGAAICAAVGHGVYPDWDQCHRGDGRRSATSFAPRHKGRPPPYQKINTVYAGPDQLH